MPGKHWNGRRHRSHFRRFQWKWFILLMISVSLCMFGLVMLISYGTDLIDSHQTSESLRDVYQDHTEIPLVNTPTHTQVSITPAPTALPTMFVRSTEPAAKLQAVMYPDNPKLLVSSRFKALQKKNRDITGWLTIGNLLDEAVVQRDEVFYMDHDALGKKNVNGAIFLDSGISLRTRPYSLILYGHNMKTGAMFGCLRNFEKLSFYHRNPFIDFDSKYEEGRYVIFAVGSVSMQSYKREYLDFFALTSEDIQERREAIDAIKAGSVYTCTIDVQPDDQLLILITCVEKDEDRRVVAARRIREGEDDAGLIRQIERSRKR